MLRTDQVEEIVTIVRSMDRDALAEHLLNFQGRFPVDFTPDFLGRQSDDRLKHLFLALCLTHGRLPGDLEPAFA